MSTETRDVVGTVKLTAVDVVNGFGAVPVIASVVGAS